MAQPPDVFPRQGFHWTLPQARRQRLLHFVVENAPFLLLLTINSVVLYNALLHPPAAAYDAGSHLAYIRILAEGRFPAPAETDQFFAPPLPYALPALAYANGLAWPYTQKLAQLLNVFLSLGTVLVLIRLARLFRPAQPWFTTAVLAVLALMPVYYKSFSFVRGEPWVTFFCCLIVYEVLAMILNAESGRKLAVRSARLGIWMGLAVLSRQWAFSLWIAVALFLFALWWRAMRSKPGAAVGDGAYSLSIRTALQPRQVAHAALIAFSAAVLVGGWFYLHLHLRFGSAAAFNRSLEPSFSLANQPPSFYSGLGNGKLFSDPVRPSFPNQLWPKLYAEFWGDYEAYFLVYGRDTRTKHILPGFMLEEALAINPAWLETNREEMSQFLGRVNLIAVGMTALLIAGFLYGARQAWLWLKDARPDKARSAYTFIWLAAAISFAGYLVFVIMVPNPGNGDTIKATYLLHISPLLALLTAGSMETIRGRTRLGYGLVWAVIISTFAFLIPTYFTHYT